MPDSGFAGSNVVLPYSNKAMSLCLAQQTAHAVLIYICTYPQTCFTLHALLKIAHAIIKVTNINKVLFEHKQCPQRQSIWTRDSYTCTYHCPSQGHNKTGYTNTRHETRTKNEFHHGLCIHTTQASRPRRALVLHDMQKREYLVFCRQVCASSHGRIPMLTQHD